MNIANLVNILGEGDLRYDFISYAEDQMIARIPDGDPFGEISDNPTNDDLARLIRYFVDDESDDAIDDQTVDEILEIHRLYLSAARIFHDELRRFDADVDMGDELADIFGSPLFYRYERLFFN